MRWPRKDDQASIDTRRAAMGVDGGLTTSVDLAPFADAAALSRWIDAELPKFKEWLETADDPSLSKRAKLREVKTHVVGQMCHVLWAWTTGDAVGPNMMTRNSYALNMAYVMQRAPVKP